MFVIKQTRREKMKDIPTIDELIKLNGAINRRLHLGDTDNFCLLDSHLRVIEAEQVGLPWSLSIPSELDVFRDLQSLGMDVDRKYYLNVGGLGGYLTYLETKLALGSDCTFFSTTEDIRAMCEASTGGSSYANAYLLGHKIYGLGKEGHMLTAVQYYRIDTENYKKLGISNSGDRLDRLVSCVEDERNRKTNE